jgi:hypothetical protein
MEGWAVPSVRRVVAAVEARATELLHDPQDPDPSRLTSRALAEVYRGLADELLGRTPGRARMHRLLDGACPAEDAAVAFGAMHEAVLELAPVVQDGAVRLAERGQGRKKAGAFFTPAALVEHLLEQTLEPALDEAADPTTVTVCDPTCGPGLFLVRAVRRITRRGVPAEQAIQQVHGADIDAAVVELARLCLALEAAGAEPPHVRCTDPLTDDSWPEAEHHVVVGNPPFLNRLETLTALRPDAARDLAARSAGTLRPYTDLSAVFLQRSVTWVRPGGRIGLVQPQSLLAARDAAGVRRYLADTCALEGLWASDTSVFDARVLTCAPVLRRGAVQGAVRRHHGPEFEELAPRRDPALDGTWSALLAAGLGIPEVVLPPAAGVLADVADCTADFRDQYYGLAPFVHEAAHAPTSNVARLVTSGLVDPAECLWGRRPTRFLKCRWDAPVIDLDALRDDPALHRWATARRVPKVLVGTQGRVIEAVVDEVGEWLPSVPTITVVPRGRSVWHLLAVLLAPPVAAHAAATYAGTALSMRAVKLSARQVGQLPLPVHEEHWDLGAIEVQAAQRSTDPDNRRRHLLRAAGHMCDAYEDSGALEWWSARIGG